MLSKTTRLIVFSAIVALMIPAVSNAGDADAGKVIFDTNCMTCHGPVGKGDGPLSAALNPKPRDLSTGQFKFDTDGDGTAGGDKDLENVIKQGAMAFGGSPLMAPWPALSEADVANLVAYIRTLK